MQNAKAKKEKEEELKLVTDEENDEDRAYVDIKETRKKTSSKKATK